jgi:hypothetical protein
MSKISIPTITRSVDLREYDPALAAEIHVWVNPTRAHASRLTEISVSAQVNKARFDRMLSNMNQGQIDGSVAQEQTQNFNAEADRFMREVFEWYAVTWSKNSETWTADEIARLADEDPALWAWLTERTQTLIAEHREQARKN